MSDLQSVPDATTNPAAMLAGTPDDIDYALGCECADPSLQIERWPLEGVTAAEPN